MVRRILKEVEIRNFRAVTYMKLPLNKINVIAGRNNTGKTTVLEALALLLTSPNDYCDFLENNVLKTISSHRGDLKHLIKVNQDSSLITGTLTDETKIELYTFRSVEKINLPENIRSKVLDSLSNYIAAELSQNKSIRGDKDREIRRILSIISPVMVLVVNSEVISVAFGREIQGFSAITLNKYSIEPVYVRMFSAKRLIEDLDKIPLNKIVVAVDKLRSLIPYFCDYRSGNFAFKYGEYYETVPISVVGDGFLALFELTLPIVFGVNVNLIEEPELHMHPGFMVKFIEELLNVVDKHGVQYIMTTHSLEFLDYLIKTAYDKNLLNLVEVIRLYRLQNGEVDYEILSGSEAYEELVELHGDLRGL